MQLRVHGAGTRGSGWWQGTRGNGWVVPRCGPYGVPVTTVRVHYSGDYSGHYSGGDYSGRYSGGDYSVSVSVQWGLQCQCIGTVVTTVVTAVVDYSGGYSGGGYGSGIVVTVVVTGPGLWSQWWF